MLPGSWIGQNDWVCPANEEAEVLPDSLAHARHPRFLLV
jgi:hypothetical protein